MVTKQRMRIASDQYSKTITQRGNVPKTLVSFIRTKVLKTKKIQMIRLFFCKIEVVQF